MKFQYKYRWGKGYKLFINQPSKGKGIYPCETVNLGKHKGK